jgi:hypothetical protein
VGGGVWFGHQMHMDEARTSLTQLDVSYVPPPPIKVQLDSDTTLSVSWSWTWSGLKHIMTESRIAQEAVLGLSFANGATLERAWCTCSS